MKRKMSAWFMLLIVVFLCSGCAAGTTATWKQEDASGLKGQSEEFVIQKFGQPYRKIITSDGNYIWEYRKGTESKAATNWIMRVGSFGTEGNLYSDVLRIIFKNKRVVSFTYDENIVADLGGVLGGAAPSSSGNSGGNSTINSSANIEPEKKIAKKEQPTPPPPKSTKANEVKVAKAPDAAPNFVAQYKSSKTFPAGKKNAIYDKIIAGAKKEGIAVKKTIKEKGVIVLSLAENDLNVIVSQPKEGGVKVDVSLNVSGESTYTRDRATEDFCRIYIYCE